MAGRKIGLAKWGAVLISLAGTLAVVWPEHADTLTKIAAAIAALFGVTNATVAYEDGQRHQADAIREAVLPAGPEISE